MMFETLSGYCQEVLTRQNDEYPQRILRRRSEDTQRTIRGCSEDAYKRLFPKKGKKSPNQFLMAFSNLKLTRVTLENRKMHAFWCDNP